MCRSLSGPVALTRAMALFVTEHRHGGETCPARDPQLAAGLLQIVNPANAKKHGIAIRAEAVASGQHHLYLIVEASDAEAVRSYFAPFGQLGTLQVTPASPCEEVVHRGAC